MTFFNNAEWIGFLAENIIRKYVSLTLEECSGCKDNMTCEILHLHNQRSLLDKIQNHFEPARGEILSSLAKLYNDVGVKLPHSDDLKKDMIVYINVGRFFLLTITPQALYYGRYINEMNQSWISEGFSESKSIKSRKKSCGKSI